MRNLLDKAVASATYRDRKRKGRGIGSGLGKTAGRGSKGAGSRAGNRVKPAFEGGQKQLFRRVAKRGFNNNAFATADLRVSLGVAVRVCGGLVTDEKLKAQFGVRGKCRVVLYGDVADGVSFEVSGCECRGSAVAAVERAKAASSART